MKSTKEISEKLQEIEKELAYINEVLMDKKYAPTDIYHYPDGTISKVEEQTFQRELTSLVAKKLLLFWVLDKH